MRRSGSTAGSSACCRPGTHPGLRDGLTPPTSTFTFAASGGGAELGGRAGDDGAAHEHGDEVAAVGLEVAVGAGGAVETVAVRDVVGADVVRVEVHPVGVDVHLHRRAPRRPAMSALARSSGLSRPPAHTSPPLASTPTPTAAVATPATDAPHAPGFDAAARGRAAVDEHAEVLAQRDDLLGGIVVAAPRADGVACRRRRR